MHKLRMNLLVTASIGAPRWMPVVFSVFVGLIAHAVWSGFADREALLTLTEQPSKPLADRGHFSENRNPPAEPSALRTAMRSIDQIERPWPARLISLQSAQTRGVQLIRLEGSSVDERASMTGRAANLLTLLNYVNRLQAEPTIKRVRLTNQAPFVSKPGDQYGANPPEIEFSVAVEWGMR